MIPSNKPQAAATPIKFGIIADVQYSNLASHFPDIRPAPEGLQKLSTAIDVLNNLELDFVINLGDLIDRDPRCFPKILKVLYASRIPVWNILGNHDFLGREYDYGHRQEALSALGLSDQTRYYFADMGAWRFIMLDTNEIGVIEHLPGTPEWQEGQKLLDDMEAEAKVNARSWNGGLGKAQTQWLAQTIDDVQKQQLSCIVFGHHPIYPKDRENLLNDQQIVDLLSSKSAVKAYICGHNHKGNYGKYRGLPCWTIEGMMDFKDKTAYADVKLYDTRMVINGYGRVKSRTLNLR